MSKSATIPKSVETLTLHAKDSRDLQGRVEYTVDLNHALAAVLLEARDPQQRRLSASHVSEIASDINSGKWLNTGDALRLSSGGTLLDGQHRLAAFLTSKKNLVLPDMIVTVLKDSKSLVVLDTAKSRTVNDLRRLLGRPPVNAKAVGGMLYEHLNFGTQGTLSKLHKIDLVDNHPFLDVIVDLSAPRKGVALFMVPVIAAAIRCMQVPGSEDLAFKFFDAVLRNSHSIDGVYIPHIEVLATWLFRQRKSTVAVRREVAVRCIQAWNSFKLGRSPSTSRYFTKNPIPVSR